MSTDATVTAFRSAGVARTQQALPSVDYLGGLVALPWSHDYTEWMERNRSTKKLIRMIGTIESGVLLVKVKEFYVFGSYARGALEPHDLDVIVVCDNPERVCWEIVERELRQPGEHIDVVLVRAIDRSHGISDLVLLWAEDDRDWQTKLKAIRRNPAAGRAAR